MLNHRQRLAAVSAGATGAVLAILFLIVVLVVRENAYRALTSEMGESLRTFTLDPKEPFDEHEFREAYPNLEVRRTQRPPPGIALGGSEQRIGDHLFLARSFRGQILTVSADWGPTERSLRLLAVVLAGLWPLLTLLIGVATWLAACAVFRPLERLTGQAADFAGASLAERLSTDDRHEFGEFAASLNGMLDRIETEVRRGDRFAADAAHELRTPLAILRARIDTALLNPRSPEEYRETLRRARAEIVRLTDVAQALLRTARGEVVPAGALALAPEIREIEEAWRDRFGERHVALQSQLEQAWSRVTPEETRMVLDNLLDNALRFSPEGSRVLIRLRSTDAVELSVADQGPGFPPELVQRAFDRLARADDGRNRASGGAGIGLSVVRRIVESRGGEARIEGGSEGGATVIVRLPAVTGSS